MGHIRVLLEGDMMSWIKEFDEELFKEFVLTHYEEWLKEKGGSFYYSTLPESTIKNLVTRIYSDERKSREMRTQYQSSR